MRTRNMHRDQFLPSSRQAAYPSTGLHNPGKFISRRYPRFPF